jgi:hypothetical protein
MQSPQNLKVLLWWSLILHQRKKVFHFQNQMRCWKKKMLNWQFLYFRHQRRIQMRSVKRKLRAIYDHYYVKRPFLVAQLHLVILLKPLNHATKSQRRVKQQY